MVPLTPESNSGEADDGDSPETSINGDSSSESSPEIVSKPEISSNGTQTEAKTASTDTDSNPSTVPNDGGLNPGATTGIVFAVVVAAALGKFIHAGLLLLIHFVEKMVPPATGSASFPFRHSQNVSL